MLKLVQDNAITMTQGIAAITQKPAKILEIQKGALTPGFAADLCIFNPTLTWEVNHDNWKSAGRNTPFWGKTLKGRVTHTIQSGKIIYSL